MYGKVHNNIISMRKSYVLASVRDRLTDGNPIYFVPQNCCRLYGAAVDHESKIFENDLL